MSKINLLPPEYKKEIEQAKANSKLLGTLFKISWIIFIVGAIYLGALFWLNQSLTAKTAEFKENEKRINAYGNLEEKSKKISERLATIRSISNNSPKWSGLIEEIQKIMPSGIYLTKVKMDDQTKSRSKISGYALTKKNVADLRDLMEKSEKFEFVDIESTSTVKEPRTKREVESFNISFTLAKGALK